jgi:signal transduction histidine kinase
LSITRERPPQEVKEKLLLSAMIDEAIEDRQNEIRLNGIKVNNHVDADVLITSNRSLLNVVVNNLLANAIKHAPGGIVDIAFVDGQLSIRDDGSGLDADDIDQLFKPGVSGPNSRGYGLGLYISKLICDQQNWQLELNNASPGTIAKIGSIQ